MRHSKQIFSTKVCLKRNAVLFSICLFGCFFVPTAAMSQSPANMINKVVIDAGHGGHDPGCLGRKSKEKDVALSLALKVGQYIKQHLPDVQVIYTRSTDTFVELHKRAQIANENEADLFLSIHLNANKSSAPYGTETYVMGINKIEANFDVAKKENAAILLEEDYAQQYDGFNPDDGFNPSSHEFKIIFGIYQRAYLEQSIDIADKIQHEFKDRVHRHDRGVKQAGFLVLYKTTMPGILIEAGFLSNPEEEDYLISEAGQEQIALAIYRGFKAYKYGMEGRSAGREKDSIKAPVSAGSDSSNHSVSNVTNDAVVQQSTLNDKGIVFKVQFTASPQIKPLNAKEFNGLQNIEIYEQNGLYKYTTGRSSTLEQANLLKEEVKKSGFPEAFVIAIKNGHRIPLEEAMKELKK